MGRRGKLLLAKILIFISFLLIAGGNAYDKFDSNIMTIDTIIEDFN